MDFLNKEMVQLHHQLTDQNLKMTKFATSQLISMYKLNLGNTSWNLRHYFDHFILLNMLSMSFNGKKMALSQNTTGYLNAEMWTNNQKPKFLFKKLKSGICLHDFDKNGTYMTLRCTRHYWSNCETNQAKKTKQVIPSGSKRQTLNSKTLEIQFSRVCALSPVRPNG